MRFIVYIQFFITILQWTLMRSMDNEYEYLFGLSPSALICPLMCFVYRADLENPKKKKEATIAMVASIYLSIMQLWSWIPLFM